MGFLPQCTGAQNCEPCLRVEVWMLDGWTVPASMELPASNEAEF